MEGSPADQIAKLKQQVTALNAAIAKKEAAAKAEAASTAEVEAVEAAAAAAAARQRSLELLGKKLAGIAAIYFIEKGVGKGLARARIKIPSSLATMLLWMGGLKAMETLNDGDASRAEAVSSALAPAVQFYGKWMTLFLTPPLTMLPMAVKTHARG